MPVIEKKKCKWLMTFFIYNNSFYEIKELLEKKGTLGDDYFTMHDQTNYFLNLIESFDYNYNVQIIIFYLNYDFLNKKLNITSLIKSKNKKLEKLENLSYNSDPLISELGMTELLEKTKTHFDYEKIIGITIGHGYLFGINQSSLKLYSEIDKSTIKIYLKNNSQFNKFINENKDLFKENELYNFIYLEYYFKILDYIKTLVIEYQKTTKYKNIFNLLLEVEKNALSKSNDLLEKISKTISLKKTNDIESLNKLIEHAKIYENLLKKHISNFTNKTNNNKTLDEIINEDGINFPMLTNKEFSSAISKSIKKLDILAMYNCNMSNIYSLYEFKNTVDYFVAPVSGISFPGYDYENIYKNLCNNSNESVENIAKSFLGFITNIKSDTVKLFENDIKNNWFISCTKVEETLLDKIKKVYIEWINNINAYKLSKKYYLPNYKTFIYPEAQINNCITTSISSCINISAKSLFQFIITDFGVFLNEFEKNISVNKLITESFKVDILKFTVELKNLIIKVDKITYIGGNFYLDKDKTGFVDKNYQTGNVNGVGIVIKKKKETDSDYLEIFFNDSNKIATPSFIEGTKTWETLFT